VEGLTSQVPDAAAVLAALPERLAADGRRMRGVRRGFRRLGIVLAVALGALLGLLLFDLGIVVVWLIGFAALAWAAVRAAR